MNEIMEISTVNTSRFLDITQHEIEALKTKHNLADAHTHQKQSITQRRIVADLPNIWYESENTTQRATEEKFIHKFFSLLNQHTALKNLNNIFLVYAASIAMQMVAIYLMRNKLSVSIVEPCFDNLHDIIKFQDVTRIPLPEHLLHNPDTIYDNLCATAVGDCLLLVDPNNPTGHSLLKHGTRGFEEVLRFCSDRNKLLILDLTFAPFAVMDTDVGRFDLYELLQRYDVSYITMEDTGKTWPIQDAKASALVVSSDIRDSLYNIHTSVLLNVSPFILNLLTRYFDDSAKDGFESVRGLLAHNRRYLVERLRDHELLEYVDPDVAVSVAWLQIKQSSFTTATALQRKLADADVYVLPGTYFYWNTPERGERFLRVALARDSERFESSIDRMLEILA